MSLGQYLIISIFLVLGGVASFLAPGNRILKVFGGLCMGGLGTSLAITSLSYFRQSINGFIIALFLFFAVLAIIIVYVSFFLKAKKTSAHADDIYD